MVMGRGMGMGMTMVGREVRVGWNSLSKGVGKIRGSTAGLSSEGGRIKGISAVMRRRLIAQLVGSGSRRRMLWRNTSALRDTRMTTMRRMMMTMKRRIVTMMMMMMMSGVSRVESPSARGTNCSGTLTGIRATRSSGSNSGAYFSR